MTPDPLYVPRQLGPVPGPVPGFAYPAWMDPGYILAVSSWKTFIVAATGFRDPPAVPGNARRIAIGFTYLANAFGQVRVSPYPVLGNEGFALVQGFDAKWFNVFDFGPMVCSEWYMVCGTPEPMRIIEWYLN